MAMVSQMGSKLPVRQTLKVSTPMAMETLTQMMPTVTVTRYLIRSRQEAAHRSRKTRMEMEPPTT